MTVGVAHTILRYKPTFGNVNQIAARDVLRLASFYIELTGKRMFDVLKLSRQELEHKLGDLGHDPAVLLAEWPYT